MTTTADIESALRAALPIDLHTSVPTLAVLLAEVVVGKLTPHEAEARIITDPTLAQMGQALLGQTINTGTTGLRFESTSPAGITSHEALITFHIVNTGGGDYAEGNIDKHQGVFFDLHIHAGDLPEVRQQKIARARRLIAGEVLANIASIDARLNFVDAALARDATERRLLALRRKIARP